MRVGRARRDELAHTLARQQLEPRPLELVDHGRRNPDVGNHEIAAERVRGRQDERDLRRGQRHRHRRFDGLAFDLVRVRRHARRQVDGDDRDAQPVHVGDDRLEQPRHRSVEARADDRVDNQVALGDLAEVQLPLLCGRDLHHRQTDAAEDLEVDAGIAPHVADAAEQKDGGLDAALRERPRDDEAVAAVVAAAAQDADLARGEILEGPLHGRHRLAPRILHEHDRGQADLVDRHPVGLAHLLRVQNSHLSVHG